VEPIVPRPAFLEFRRQTPDHSTRLMSFHICKDIDGAAIWLTAIFPAIKWGPREQALAFRTGGHAQQVLARLQKNASCGAKIVDGGTSGP
jgi:hypothetical protein